MSLALQLSLSEAIDLMSRVDKTFSPNNVAHTAYQELIIKFDRDKMKKLKSYEILPLADEILVRKGIPELPDDTRY